MAVKLYRCKNEWVKIGAHPCWKVEKALIDAGVDYEIVPGPLSRKKRDAVEAVSGQKSYPVIVLEDGTVYREESKDMARRIREGRLESG